jgi:tRNA threonylcarbamoyladenosine biosynthesis protein TsaE
MHRVEKGQTFEKVALEGLNAVATEIIQLLGSSLVVVFHGEMGAGKTTLIKALGKALGVIDTMSSPTFSIVNEYETDTDRKVYHFDFYRIKNETEAYDIGVEEYFDSGHLCLVEWPEKIPSLLPAAYSEVFITTIDDTHRTIAL